MQTFEKTFSNISHQKLGFFPTPIVRLKKLEELLGGPKIFMKRDDQTGLGLGGNKTRKLEFLLGQALEEGSDCLITAGAMQSNHCRQTAAAAALCGLDCHLVLGGNAPDIYAGNLLLDTLFGATIHWCGERRKGEDAQEIALSLKKKGKKPYMIPYGGSNSIGALGFVAAMFELERQQKEMDIHLNHILFASSSAGTHSGMMVGKELAGTSANLMGISIDKEEFENMSLRQYIQKLAGDCSQYLQQDLHFDSDDIYLNEEYLGDGYGVVGDVEREAISLLAQKEGILLDPVYTGRAMGGMIDLIRKNRFSADETLLFWHTGGTPALFAYADQLQIFK